MRIVDGSIYHGQYLYPKRLPGTRAHFATSKSSALKDFQAEQATKVAMKKKREDREKRLGLRLPYIEAAMDALEMINALDVDGDLYYIPIDEVLAGLGGLLDG